MKRNVPGHLSGVATMHDDSGADSFSDGGSTFIDGGSAF